MKRAYRFEIWAPQQNKKHQISAARFAAAPEQTSLLSGSWIGPRLDNRSGPAPNIEHCNGFIYFVSTTINRFFFGW